MWLVRDSKRLCVQGLALSCPKFLLPIVLVNASLYRHVALALQKTSMYVLNDATFLKKHPTAIATHNRSIRHSGFGLSTWTLEIAQVRVFLAG